jgi:hypothetical protein
LTLADTFAVLPLDTLIGFAGEMLQVAAARAVASQVALIFPEYCSSEVNVRFATAWRPGTAEIDGVPVME